jgi:3-phosphoshikimate 1-carboxyvinyltransferase
VTLTGALASEDTHLMAEALRRLGVGVCAAPGGTTLQISGQENAFQGHDADLFVGLAGTAARFLTALCAAAPRGVYRFDGVPQMRRRPMLPLIRALRQLGADIRCLGEEGFFPLEIRARGLSGGRVELDPSESSQLLSALLMVAPLAREAVEIQLTGGLRRPFVEMTAALLERFGQPPPVWQAADLIAVQPHARYAPPGGTCAIEPDATAASYFAALPLVVGGGLELLGLQPSGQGLQGDTRFLEVLKKCGLQVASGPAGVHVGANPGRALGVRADFSAFSDTFLTLAAIAPLLSGTTRIEGIAHTRKQETDRVAGMARELRRLGQEVREEEGALEITPRPLRLDQTIDTHEDHRFAMSFAILGCHDLRGDGRPWLTLAAPGCCAKTFPSFFAVLEELRRGTLTS